MWKLSRRGVRWIVGWARNKLHRKYLQSSAVRLCPRCSVMCVVIGPDVPGARYWLLVRASLLASCLMCDASGHSVGCCAPLSSGALPLLCASFIYASYVLRVLRSCHGSCCAGLEHWPKNLNQEPFRRFRCGSGESGGGGGAGCWCGLLVLGRVVGMGCVVYTLRVES